MLHNIDDTLQDYLMMIVQSLVQKYFNQVLNSFCRVFIILFLLEVIFLKILDHLLSSCAQLAIKLNHRHVLNHKVISANALLIFLIIGILILVAISSG
jgi:hypothetical protein